MRQRTSDVPSLTADPVAVTPPPRSPRSWLRRIWGGGVITEVCPEWCTATHAKDQGRHLDDITHSSTTISAKLHLDVDEAGREAWPILLAKIESDPHSEREELQVPYVTFEPSSDDIIQVMGPDEFAALIGQIRDHCDRLDRLHGQLIEARAEYGA
jgi:hypothetical protein